MSPAESGPPTAALRALELTASVLQRARANERGFVLCERGGAFDVDIGQASVDRALAILQALTTKLLDAGMSLVAAGEAGTMAVSVGGEVLAFALIEDSAKREHQLTAKERGLTLQQRRWRQVPTWDYFPSGVLALEIREPRLFALRRRWGESRRGPLEGMLGLFLKGLGRAATYVREARQRREEWERQYEDERRRSAEAAERKKLEAERLAQLLAEVEAWRTACAIRAYVEVVRANWSAAGEPETGFERWAAWAEGAAGSIGPCRLRSGGG